MALVLDPVQFKLDYTQFATLSDGYLTNVYDEEALILGRKVIALFNNTDKMYYWSCVVLAHILTLTASSGIGTQATGRTTAATEGSVSGSFEYKGIDGSEWWSQTAYGQKIWQLMRQRGGATYFASPCTNSIGWGYY